jgi:N12 class adenine-specific DNA methylase
MAEMFTMQRYLPPDDLQKHKLHHFDGWAATFGEPVTAMFMVAGRTIRLPSKITSRD